MFDLFVSWLVEDVIDKLRKRRSSRTVIYLIAEAKLDRSNPMTSSALSVTGASCVKPAKSTEIQEPRARKPVVGVLAVAGTCGSI